MWKEFFAKFNGIQVFHDRFWSNNADVELFTDSSGGLGFGVFFAGKWVCERWPKEWHASDFTKDITVLELFPIYIALYMWGFDLRNKKINFRSDNMSVCHIINKMTSKSELVMTILRKLTLKCLECNIVVRAEHIRGINNSITDALSRFQMTRFRKLAPRADPLPCKMPVHLWQIFTKQSTS